MPERTVVWTGVANFSKARREADQTKRSFEELRASQDRLNASSAAASLDPSQLAAYAKAAKSASGETNKLAIAQQRQVQAMRDLERETSNNSAGIDSVTGAINRYQQATRQADGGRLAQGMSTTARSARDMGREVEGASSKVRDAGNEAETAGRRFRGLRTEVDNAGGGFGDFVRSLGSAGGAWRAANKEAADARWEIVRTKLAIVAAIPAIDMLANGLSSLAAGAVGMAGALAPAVGALGALPGVLAAAGGGVGTLLAGFSGIGAALKAYQQQQKSMLTATGQSQQNNAANQRASLAINQAETARQNAQAIRNAQQAITQARQQAARSAVDSARRVRQAETSVVDAEVRGAQDISAAEDNVTQAQQRQRQAQLDISAARKAAARNIDDLRRQLRGQALDERGASLSLEEAQLRLRQVINDPGSTDLQRREARLAVDQAKNSLADTQQQNKDLTKQYQDASKKGVEGSDQVVQAKQNEAQAADATRKAEQDLANTRIQAAKSVAKAQSDLSQARLEQSRAAQDSARSIAKAEQGLADALKENELRNRRLALQQRQVADSATQATSQTLAFNAAMKQLTPEARAVVKQLLAMKKQVDAIRATAQRGMLPGFLDFLLAVATLFPQVRRFVRQVSRDFGDFFSELAGIVRTTGFVRDFGDILDSTRRIIRMWLRGSINIGKVLGRITRAAIPLTEWLTRVALGWTQSWEQMTRGEKGQKRLTKFFQSTRKTLTLLGRILGNFAGALHTMGSVAAQAVGYDLLNSLAQTMETFNAFTKSARGRNAIAEWAKAAGPVVKQLGGLFIDLVMAIGAIGKNVDFAGFVKQIRDQLLPALVQLFSDLKPGEGMKMVVPLLTKIVNGFDAIVKKLGGSKGILTFLGQLVDVFQAITRHIPAKVLEALLAVMVVGRVTRFVDKITGLSDTFKLFTDSNSPLRQSIALFKQWRKRADEAASAAQRAGKGIRGSGATPRHSAGPSTPRRAAPGRVRRAGGAVVGGAKRAGGAVKSVGSDVASGAAQNAGMLAGLAKKLPSILGAAIPVIISFASEIAAAIASIPVIGWIIAAIIAVLAIVIPLVIKHWDSIKKVFSAAIGWIVSFSKKVWGKLVDIFGGPFAAIWKVISFGWKMLVALFKTGFQIIRALVQIAWGAITLLIIRPWEAVWGTIFKLLKAAAKWIWSHLGDLVRGIGKVLSVIGKVISWPFVQAYRLVRDAVGAVASWLVKRFRDLIKAVVAVWHWIKDRILQPFWDAIAPLRRAISSLWNKLMSFLAPVFAWISRQFGKIVHWIAQPFKDAWTAVKPYLNSLWNGVKSAVQKVGDWLGKIGGWAQAAWKAFADAVSDPVAFVVTKIINPLIGAYNKIADTFDIQKATPVTWNPPHYQSGSKPKDTSTKSIGVAGGGNRKLQNKQAGGSLRDHNGAGFLPGTKSTKRDNMLGVSGNGQPIARVEPGEYVMPRWMKPIFPVVENIRRTKRLPGRKSGGELVRPTRGTITQGVHDQYTGFPAVDFGVPVGTPVVAGASGRVVISKDIFGDQNGGYASYGRYIEIASNGFKTLYAHLSERMAQVGQMVKAGTEIGLSGNTGHSTGPHLHFGAQGISPEAFLGKSFSLSGVAGTAVNAVKDTLGNALGPLTGAWNSLKGKIGGIPGGNFGKLLGAMVGKLGSGVMDFAKQQMGAGATWNGQGVGHLDTGQLNNAATIIATAKRLGFGDRGALIGLMTAMQESTLRNLNYGDRDSLGIFQQRSAWGSAADRENVAKAAQMFFMGGQGGQPGLRSVNWKSGSLAAAAQAVQVSAFPGAYAKWESLARQLLAGQNKGYARGSTGASPGWRLTGEHGPEWVKFKGGEKVLDHKSSKVAARMGVPGYDQGGVVRGFRPGATAPWVAALRSQLYMGESKHWGSDLTRALQRRNGVIPAYRRSDATPDHGVTAGQRVAKLFQSNPRGARWGDWEWIAKQVHYDPTRLFRYWEWINRAVTKSKAPKARKQALGKAHNAFWNKRKGWVKSLGYELGMPGVGSSGVWSSDITGPLKHITAHGLGWKVGTHGHGEWSPRPWKRWSGSELQRMAAEQAISEQTRSNKLNAEWDRMLKQLTGWGYSYAVRKLTDVGTSDGMDIARGLVKNRSLANRYNANAKIEYDRTDAQSNSGAAGSEQAQITSVLNALRSGPTGMGLTSLAKQVSLSVDTTANLVKKINSGRRWGDIIPAKRTRLLKDVSQFGNLFHFQTGGDVPGSGNGDRVPAMLTPGELVIRKPAVRALRQDLGNGVGAFLNHYDKMAVGGFAAAPMRGTAMPHMGALGSSRFRVDGDYVEQKTVNINTTVNNPISEEPGLSVQKRISAAQALGMF